MTPGDILDPNLSRLGDSTAFLLLISLKEKIFIDFDVNNEIWLDYWTYNILMLVIYSM